MKSGLRDTRLGLLRRIAPRVGASLLIAVGFVWLLSRGGLPLLPERSAFARFPIWAIAVFALLHAVSMLLRTYRWVYLLRPIAPKIKSLRILGFGLVGFSAIFLAPLRTGEFVRPFLVAQDGEVTFLQAAGSIFAERVIDGVVLTVAATAALLMATKVSPLPDSLGDLPLPVATLPAAVYTATLAFCALLLAMTLFYVARDRARRALRWSVGLVSERAADWASTKLERVADGLSFLPSRSHLLSFVAATGASWLLVFVAQWIALRAAGLPASFAQACAMVGILGLGVVVPAGPGLFGAYQIASFSALALFFPLAQVRSEGAVLVFIAYAMQLVLAGVECLLGFLLMAKVPAAPR